MDQQIVRTLFLSTPSIQQQLRRVCLCLLVVEGAPDYNTRPSGSTSQRKERHAAFAAENLLVFEAGSEL